MGGILAIGEIANGAPTRLTLELATLARGLAASSGLTASVLLAGEGASGAAAEVAAYGVPVVAVDVPTDGPTAAATAAQAAALTAERAPDWVLIGASPDGKDVAGALVGLTDLPVLVNGSAVTWADGGPQTEMSTFGGRLVTQSRITGGRGIVLVRPGAVAAEPAGAVAALETIAAVGAALPAVRVVERVQQAAASAAIEEARVIVGGGRGVGGPEGFGIITDLADAFGGAVGATRAVVDAGWIGYSQQIGQTGKMVKPELYIAAGISGAIQHKVGVQTAGTIVAINKDPDAPIVEFADLVVVGDLFEVVPRLTAAVRARKGG
ncbi:MAG: electron transfer flavoprotein subunit alpha/FixB family protein [Chloroflexota bacterium]